MTGIDIVASCPGGVGGLPLALVPCDALEEGPLFVGVCLPQQASHLVVADADALEQVLHPTGRIADPEGIKKPLANLIGVAEAAGADLLLELVDLRGAELAGVALVVQSTQGVEPLVAIDAEPFAQLAVANAQQVSDVFTAFALGNAQDGREALVDTPIRGLLAASFDVAALPRSQENRFHEHRGGPGDGLGRWPSLSQCQSSPGLGSSSPRLHRASSPALAKTASQWLTPARSTPKK